MKTFNELMSITNQLEPSASTAVRFKISKADADKHLAFGWASVANDEDGKQLVDWHGDMIDLDELESAAYNFVRLYRDADEMHVKGTGGAGTLVESVVFTPDKLAAMGIDAGVVPYGWWVGFLVLDPDVWAKVKDGTYSMFSIEGKAVREKVDDSMDDDSEEDPDEDGDDDTEPEEDQDNDGT